MPPPRTSARDPLAAGAVEPSDGGRAPWRLASALDAWLSSWPPLVTWAVSTVGVLAVGVLDHLTGWELSFSVFYLVPVSLAAWYAGARAARITCLASAVVWLLIDRAGHTYSTSSILLWNAAVRLAFFVVTAELLVALGRAYQRERALARTDALTGIPNLREFRRRSAEAIERAARSGRAITIAYLDIDDFKGVNDALGHAEGDRVLRIVATDLERAVRRTDAVARLGGDEFGIVLWDTDRAGAEAIVGAVHERLTALAREAGWSIGFSIGAAVFPTAPDSAEEAIALADDLMYRVKQLGKDGVTFEEPDTTALVRPHAERPVRVRRSAMVG